MGNSLGAQGAARKFLEPEPDWQDYYIAEWRSECARELDRYGGPGRPAVPRGNSVTARLNFLQGALRGDQKRIRNALQVDEDDKGEQKKPLPQTQEPSAPVVLHTDARARARKGEAYSLDDLEVPSGPRDFSLLSKGVDPAVRARMAEQRRKMLEYAHGVNAVKGAPAIKPLNLPDVKSKVSQQWKDDDHSASGPRRHSDDGAAHMRRSHAGDGPPADWRLRNHQARRRTMLVVQAAVKWQMALNSRPGPKRMPRVLSLRYYIPQVLGDEGTRFIEEAKVAAELQAAEAKDHSPARPSRSYSRAVSRCASRANLTTAGGSRKGNGPDPLSPYLQPQPSHAHSQPHLHAHPTTESPAVDGVGGSASPEPGADRALPSVRLPGGVAPGSMARRGRSDSGATWQAHAGLDAAAAEMLRKRPSLLDQMRPSSGKLLIAPGNQDQAPVANRISDGGDPCSNSRSSFLPTINAYAGSANSRASAPEIPMPPSGPRPPRGRPGPRRSLSNGRERAPRRSSDTAVVAIMQRRMGAVGGLDAASGGVASPGAARRSGLAGGGAAALLERHVGRMSGPRVSDGGSTAPGRAKRASGSEDAGGAARLGLKHAAAGGGGGSVGDVWPPARRSDCGVLRPVHSGPPTGRPLQAGPDSPGFLPAIPAGQGAGAGSGAGAAALKPLTVAQARRLALLAEANGSTGSNISDDMTRAALSPSRLSMGQGAAGAPHKAGAGPFSLALARASADSSERTSSLSLLGPLSLSPSGAAAPAIGSRGTPRGSSNGFTVALGPGGVAPVGILDTLQETAAALSRRCSLARDVGAPASPLNSPALYNVYRAAPDGAAPAPLQPPASAPKQPPVAASTTDPPCEPSAAASAPSITTPPSCPAASPACSSPGAAPAAAAAAPPLAALSFQEAPAASATSSADASLECSANASTGSSSSAASTSATAPTATERRPVPPREAITAGGKRRRTLTVNVPPPLDSEAAARLAKAHQLMAMYANRCNGLWAEQQTWVAPGVLASAEMDMFCASDAWLPYKLYVQKLLKNGGYAVHIDACQDAVRLPNGTTMDLWTSDPWVVVQGLRPGSLPMSDRIEGVSLGSRVLRQLVLCLEAAAGRDAVSKLVVVLAINEDQRNAVVADVIRSGAYGLKPDNLILTAQRKRFGYRYDRSAAAFLEDPTTPPEVVGGGLSLCQLAWLGDAFRVQPATGECVMLMGSTVLERLEAAGCEWLLCRRARDLALLSGEEGAGGGPVDLKALAWAAYAADRHGGNMVLQAAAAASLTVPRAYDSTLLAIKGGNRAAAPRSRAASSAAAAAGVVAAATPDGAGGGATAGAGGGTGSSAAGVVDMRSCELSTPVLVEALTQMRRQAGHEGWVGLQRYAMHVPTLHGLLHSLGLFRKKLAVVGDVLRLSMDVADLTADPRAACVALQARDAPAILTSPNEVDDLIPLLLAQDRSAAFRHSLSADAAAPGQGDAACGGAAAAGPQVVAGAAAAPGTVILLFVAANDVTQLAVNLVLLMARPGRDVVHVCTVVHSSLQLAAGQQLVAKYLTQISGAMVEAHAEVLVKGGGGLLEVMEGAAGRLAPALVVMASAALTLQNLNTASVMGSVTLSVLKRLSLPVAVVTANSKHLLASGRRTGLRALVCVDSAARPMVSFLCGRCMEPMRGDKLTIAAHYPTRQMTTQQQQTQRRLLEMFGDVATSHRFHSAPRVQLDGPIDRALAGAVEETVAHLVGLALPAGTRGAPQHVLGLIRAARGAVLVYRE